MDRLFKGIVGGQIVLGCDLRRDEMISRRLEFVDEREYF